jgi:hypothetical protein
VAKLMGESELVGDRSLAPTLPLLKAAAKLYIKKNAASFCVCFLNKAGALLFIKRVTT